MVPAYVRESYSVCREQHSFPTRRSSDLAGQRSCIGYTATVGVAAPHAPHSHGGMHPLYQGAEFLNASRRPSHLHHFPTRRSSDLKNEPAEVRDSCTGWREQNSALCSQRLVREGNRSCMEYTETDGVYAPHAPHSHGGMHPLYQGAEF